MQLVHALHEPAGDGPHPTLIALHGWGANALDLLGLAPHLLGGRLLVICPQGPIVVPIGPGAQGYGWFPLSMGRPPDGDAFAAAYATLDAFLTAAVQRYAPATRKIALLGFSQGGVMAYALALRQPQRFAAVAALSTWLVPELVVAAGSTPALERLPVLVQHGSADQMIGIERGRDAVPLLRQWDADLVYREYDMGHEISGPSLRDLNDFLQRHLVSPLITA